MLRDSDVDIDRGQDSDRVTGTASRAQAVKPSLDRLETRIMRDVQVQLQLTVG
jgi:hypothetical protein